jgi:hypothetical protein
MHCNINKSTSAQAYPLYFSKNKMRKQSIDHPTSAINNALPQTPYFAQSHMKHRNLWLRALLTFRGISQIENATTKPCFAYSLMHTGSME